jgi:hypothetical protein
MDGERKAPGQRIKKLGGLTENAINFQSAACFKTNRVLEQAQLQTGKGCLAHSPDGLAACCLRGLYRARRFTVASKRGWL